MAKKKAAADGDEVVVEEKKEAKSSKKSLEEYILSADSFVQRKQIVIPVSPAIDMMLGGGIPEGSFVIPTGQPKVGKTVLCLQFAANAQLPKYACDIGDPLGREVYFFNIEGRLKPRDIQGIRGINTSRFHLIQSKPGDILHGEDYIDIGERLINEKPGCIFIFDSFSQLCTRGEQQSDIGDRYRADAPVLLAKFCRRICNVIPINKCVVMGITHQIANQNPMAGSKWTEASGQKIQYEVDVKLKAKYKEAWKVGDTQIGQDVHWHCECSAIGPPNTDCVSKLRYGYGLDFESELVDIGSAFGLLTKGGSWYTFSDGKKCQGAENARDYLVSKPELTAELNQSLRTMLGLDK